MPPITKPSMTPALYSRLREEMYREIIAEINAGGGGGGTVIPNDGTLTGTVVGPVFCEGDVNVTGTLTVQGDLFIAGSFYNGGAYEVTILGDLICQGIYFDNNAETPQSNFTVNGDLIFTYMEFYQYGGSNATLRVGGDLIGATGGSGTTLYGYGNNPATQGLNVVVYGDISLSYIDLDGGYGDGSGIGGQGGSLTVYGNLTLYDGYLSCDGGDAYDYDAGNGGYVYVGGSVSGGSAEISVNGGQGNNGSGGNGGYIELDGHVSLFDLYANGGDCHSDNEIHRAGNAGQAYIEGFLEGRHVYMTGGYRQGNLSAGASNTPAYGGHLQVSGCSLRALHLEGGDTNTTNYSAQNAGGGGTLDCIGSVSTTWSVYVNGGNAYGTGNAGGGGQAYIRDGARIGNNLDLSGGYTNINGYAGNGGYCNIKGHAYIDNIRFYGDNAVNGDGGNGGQLDVQGHLHINNYCDFDGGACNSANENYNAGLGGVLYAHGINSESASIFMYGGDRYGNTSAPSPGGQRNGGSLNCYGDAVLSYVDMSGSDNFTTYPSAPGGNGGYLYVEGTLTMNDDLDSYGGRGIGNYGGNGGYIEVSNAAKIDNIYLDGGPSLNSAAGPDATTNGPGGSATFNGGLICNDLEILDGSGDGSSPTNTVTLRLQGSCYIDYLYMTDRADCQILTNTAPTTLKVNTMPAKKTLNNSNGSATADISGSLADSIFTSGGGGWYAITGTGI